MISEDKKRQILDHIDIVREIGKFVSLKKSGKSYHGLCPFHEDHTPSFFIDVEKQIFNCFGCGESGNVITFTMKHQNMSYPEAVKYLAREAGIEVSQTKPKNGNQYFGVRKWVNVTAKTASKFLRRGNFQ